ncbi:WD40 repeat-containing protein [Mycolicibacterium conceptionense]|uniref:WD40 repeat-containing protein n=1 Tax=Mycolicibacterium conceptionense TaxID=451644 RepID=A0A0U1DAF0_9MYCO|nr:WD40 repeat-containing protein [Mycolicibacterium conceptionense]
MRIWDADSGQLIGNPLDQEQSIQEVVFSPDGSTVAVGTLDSIRLFKVDSGERLQEMFQDSWVLDTAFSRMGSSWRQAVLTEACASGMCRAARGSDRP